MSSVPKPYGSGRMIIDEVFYADRLIEVLKARSRMPREKIFLIRGNLRVHHSKRVKAWLEENKEMIEVFYLSGCNPVNK